ncbi:BPSL0761 family protein [Polaromonas naphthalenivorans]|uniref:BPSL0761 family protein n=1 Tax=Polaromonas naphthalenivorans TaxID=216465 RepID=UPI0012ED1160|nr:BPSL0761 family protein [Polaromonas naphthalenivorans]
MTLPAERTRAIIYTKQFLERLLVPRLTPDVPESVRQEARGLLRHYPGTDDLEIAHRALPDWFGPARKAED